MVVELVLANTIVVPSGAARAAVRMAMTPLAPGRLSTTTCWPSAAESLLATIRAMVSLPPPDGNGTIMVMVRLGKSWAAAGPWTSAIRIASARPILRIASLHLQIELADQRAPAAVLALDVGAVFFRRRRQRIAAVGGNAGAHVGRVDAGAKREVETLDDRVR